VEGVDPREWCSGYEGSLGEPCHESVVGGQSRANTTEANLLALQRSVEPCVRGGRKLNGCVRLIDPAVGLKAASSVRPTLVQTMLGRSNCCEPAVSSSEA